MVSGTEKAPFLLLKNSRVAKGSLLTTGGSSWGGKTAELQRTIPRVPTMACPPPSAPVQTQESPGESPERAGPRGARSWPSWAGPALGSSSGSRAGRRGQVALFVPALRQCLGLPAASFPTMAMNTGGGLQEPGGFVCNSEKTVLSSVLRLPLGQQGLRKACRRW